MRRTPRSSSAPQGDGDGGSGPEQVLEFASQAVEYVRRSLGVTLEYDSETLPILDHYLRHVTSAAVEPKNNSGSGNESGSGNGNGSGNGRGSGNGNGSGNGHGHERVGTTELVAATAGAYFGEVVRRRLGGSWHLPSEDPGTWRMVLPSGLWFWPAAMAMAAILGPEGDALQPSRGADARDPDDDDDPELREEADIVDEDGESSADSADSEGGWDASLQVPPLLRGHVARVLESMADVSEDEYYSLCCRLDTLEHVQAVLAAMAQSRRSGGSDAMD